MQRDSFTKALRATAKIACAASLLNVGCKNKAPTEIAAPAKTVDQTLSEPSPEVDGSAAPQMEASNEERIDRDPTESEFQECQPVIQEEFAKEAFPRAENISQELKDCCALTAEYYDALSAETGNFNVTMDWEHRDQCCSAIEWRGGTMACTPWGPPTPPSARKMKRSIIVHQRKMTLV